MQQGRLCRQKHVLMLDLRLGKCVQGGAKNGLGFARQQPGFMVSGAATTISVLDFSCNRCLRGPGHGVKRRVLYGGEAFETST